MGPGKVSEKQEKVSADQAKLYAGTELEKYCIVQERLFMSDYNRCLSESI